ncbi:MAG: hypothetical protein JWN70_513 [Planctomycetaceae bacterium]|nr:hypothetical protein [Planctomycetaceae bacterium]
MPDQLLWPLATNPANHPGPQPTAMADVPDVDENVWRRYVHGESVPQISDALSRSTNWVQLTINRLLEQRGSSPPQSLRGHVEKLLDEVCLLRQASWSEWERSKTDKVRTVKKTKEGGPRGGGGSELTQMTETRTADATFLRMLMDCNRRESALRGIERPLAGVMHFKQPRVDLDTMIQQVEAANALMRQRHVEPESVAEHEP